MKPKTLLSVIVDFSLGGLTFAILGYLLYDYWRDMTIFTFYIGLMASAFLLLGTLATGLILHGIGLIHPRDLDKKTHVIIATIYIGAALSGLILGLLAIYPNLAIVQEDLGIEFANVIAALFSGATPALVLLAIEHVRASKGNTLIVRNHWFSNGDERTSRKKHVNAIGYLHLAFFAFILLGGVATYALTGAFEEDPCCRFQRTFSDPAYDLDTVLDSDHFNSVLDNDSYVNQTLLEAIERALWTMTKTQTMGGFPMKGKPDGSEFYSDRGEGCPLYPGEFSLQAGTPKIATVYLEMYKAEPNPVYLGVATAAADALLAIQDDENGGFYYDGRRYPDGEGYQPHPRNHRRSAVFDDNVMQSCVSFLLDVYTVTNDDTYKDAAIRGLDYIFELEKPGGGWPQRSNYSPEEYPSYVTLNDDCMEDIVFLLLKAYDVLNDTRYLQAAERGGQFLIRVQGNGAGNNTKQQGAWAQQYNNDQPAWARAFEPPAMCSSQTGAGIRMLMELYLYTANVTYLEPIPAAISWLNDSNTTIPDPENPGKFIWSRLYELETNHLIVGNRNNQESGPVYYYDYNETRDFGYSWIGTYGLNGTIDNYYELVDTYNKNITQYRESKAPSTDPDDYVSSAGTGYNRMDTTSYFWYNEDGYIDSGDFEGNAMRIIRYLAAC